MYADKITPSMAKAIDETNRRRLKQIAYNTERGVDPQPLRKRIVDILDGIYRDAEDTEHELVGGSGRQQSRGKAPVPGLSSRPGRGGRTSGAGAHAKDLAVQAKYGVRYIKYWYDAATGKVFCLSEAPSKEAALAVHREAHGQMPDDIFEVQEFE